MSTAKWLSLAERLIHGGGASTMTWRHVVTRTEDVETGAVTETTADQSFLGAVTDAVRTRLFTDAVLARTSTAIIVRPQDFTSWSPAMLDRVALQPGVWLPVVDIKAIQAPGGTSGPVAAALIIALGSP